MMDNKDELTFELQKALAEKEIMEKVNVRVRLVGCCCFFRL